MGKRRRKADGRRVFSTDFKVAAVQRVVASEKTVAELSRELDIPLPWQNWTMIPAPYGLHMREAVFDAITQAARLAGDEELVVMNAESFVTEPAAALSFDYSKLDEVRCTTLGHVETHLFGYSGSWGVASSVDDFSCIGGQTVLMSAMVRTLGGRDTTEDTFSRFANEEWQVTEVFKRRLFESIGWK